MRRLFFGLMVAASLAACSGDGDDKSSSKAPAMTLRVMTFNIFYGGDEMKLPSRDWCTDPAGCQDTFAAVAQAIKQSKADIVGLQEATGNTRKLAVQLGWHFNERTAVISHFPIIDPGGADGLYVFVEPTPGRVVAISNVHLPATPYGPYKEQRGWTDDEVVALEERVRLPAIEQQVDELPQLAQQKIPVFLTGDFNSPSHLDGAHGIEWPVSKALADAGFKDSFRAANPDPAARPGFTWTPGGPESVPNEVHDRIDWVLSMGPARAVESGVVGEAGNENVDIALPQWPSDHRGTVSTFRVTPAETEYVAVASRSLEQGQAQQVLFHADDQEAKPVVRPAGEIVDGRIETDSLAPGRYEVALPDGVKTEFWIYAPGTGTTITTSKSTYKAGQPVEVSWTNAPGMKWDWVAAFPAGDGAKNRSATDCPIGYCGNGNYIGYEYTDASIEGSTELEGLKPGRYDVRLLIDDGYTRAAISEPFEVVKP
jgi:endonuclease/exonuclease/phosphatase family metal-dependent hydrolase